MLTTKSPRIDRICRTPVYILFGYVVFFHTPHYSSRYNPKLVRKRSLPVTFNYLYNRALLMDVANWSLNVLYVKVGKNVNRRISQPRSLEAFYRWYLIIRARVHRCVCNVSSSAIIFFVEYYSRRVMNRRLRIFEKNHWEINGN